MEIQDDCPIEARTLGLAPGGPQPSEETELHSPSESLSAPICLHPTP